ncbi:MAG: AMP-binding protein [Deltaproteobacteria bacterium]|nr:AMP-binding protein [Deltaproteobacteria bacterium]
MTDPYAAKPWLAHYDAHVSASLEYQGATVPELIRDVARRVPDRPALHFMGRTFTFGELDGLSERAARHLVDRGVRPGEVVALHLPNIPAGYAAFLASQKVGGVLTGLSPLLTPVELEHQLRDSGATSVFTLDATFGRLAQVLAHTAVKTVVVSSVADYLPGWKRLLGRLLHKIPTGPVTQLAGVDVTRLNDLAARASVAPVDVTVAPDGPCLMMYTGGTTGPAKGATITHRNVLANRHQVQTWLDLREGHTLLSAFPLFHIAGLFLGMCAYATGLTQIAVPNPRDSAFLVDAIRRYRPSAVVNVTTVFLELMKQPAFRALDLGGVEWFLSAAAPFPPANIAEFEAIIGPGKLLELYGMTEASPVIACLPRYGKKKPGSVGMPLPDTEMKLVDPASGEVAALGEPGEVLVRGPQVFAKGYHNQPAETAHALQDGWLHTGDIARMDEDGYLYLVDRVKDMVNISGLKVFSREIDDLLGEHPKVAQGATVGLPDPERPGSERVVCVVVLRAGVDPGEATRAEILAYLAVRLAPYKRPKRLEFMASLPTSGVGKVLKRELREMLRGPTT